MSAIGNELHALNALAECEHHIRALDTWLTTHEPKPNWTSQQIQARTDRVRSLGMWRRKYQTAVAQRKEI
jgi:hypothetical protein